MNQALAAESHADFAEPGRVSGSRLDLAGWIALAGVAGAIQFSIAAAQILLTIALVCWVALLVIGHERFEAPRFFWPLLAYAGITLISAVFSVDPRASFIDSRQLLLFLIVPLAYRFATGSRALTLMTVVLGSSLYGTALLTTSTILPQMQGALSATQDEIAWVMTFNILATAVVTPMTGWLVSRFGTRRVMIWSAMVWVRFSSAVSSAAMVAYSLLTTSMPASAPAVASSICVPVALSTS